MAPRPIPLPKEDISLDEAEARMEAMLTELHKDNQRQDEKLDGIHENTGTVKTHTSKLIRIGIVIVVLLLFIAAAVAHMAGWLPLPLR